MRWRRQPSEDERKRDLKVRGEALERELAEAREAGDRLAEAIALNNLGTVAADLEDWATALERYAAAAATVPAEASLDERLTPHGNAANAARRLKDWPAALAHAVRVDAEAQAAGSAEQLAIASSAIALVRKAVGDEFETLLKAAIAELPEALAPQVRVQLHLNPTHVGADRPGRNDPCPCGSGKKYKHCHLKEDLAAAGKA